MLCDVYVSICILTISCTIHLCLDKPAYNTIYLTKWKKKHNFELSL